MARRKASSKPVKQESRTFLVELFASLRDDLAEQVREGGKAHLNPQKAARDLATYEALLTGLTSRGGFPDEEEVRRYVVGLAQATDEANGFEQATLEHRAFRELVAALGGETAEASFRT
jgi:hypothetical protein